MHVVISKIKHPALRFAVMLLYYAAILAAVMYVQFRANYATPPFIYQSF